MMKMLLVSLCIFSAKYAVAQQVNDHSYNDFYTVSEQDQSQAAHVITDMSPAQALQDVLGEEALSELKAKVYDLLKLDHHQENFGEPSEPYKRLQHFGTWKHNGDCYNTRAEVLIRDSRVKPEFGSGGCTVTRGEWLDPYTDGVFNQASEIQIDHVVPLKNAYINGAWKWDFKKRCLYGNFMSNTFHLLSVNGHENMKKGDKGPEGYMPPNGKFSCEYLQTWLKIKLIWQLHLTDDEEKAVNNLVEQNNCNVNDFKYTARDLTAQRNFMAKNADLCAN